MVTAFEMKFQQINLIVSPNNQTVPRFFWKASLDFILELLGTVTSKLEKQIKERDLYLEKNTS